MATCCCEGELKLAEVEASYIHDPKPFTESHRPGRCEIRCAAGRALRIIEESPGVKLIPLDGTTWTYRCGLCSRPHAQGRLRAPLPLLFEVVQTHLRTHHAALSGG